MVDRDMEKRVMHPTFISQPSTEPGSKDRLIRLRRGRDLGQAELLDEAEQVNGAVECLALDRRGNARNARKLEIVSPRGQFTRYL